MVLGTPFFHQYYITMDYATGKVTVAHPLSADKHLTGGQIAMIVLAVLAVVLGLGCVAYACVQKKKAKDKHYATLYEKAIE